MKKRKWFIMVILIILSYSLLAMADNDLFEVKKQEYSSAAMIELKINIIVLSDIFDEADTASGEIVIANDGRYRANINQDIYLYDGQCIWEYSEENAQATMDCLKEGEQFENKLVFLKNLDQYYSTHSIKENAQYLLTKRTESDGNLPDSLTLYLNNSKLAELDYHDINGDLNKIKILSEAIFNSVDSSIFMINLPDSVEIIELP